LALPAALGVGLSLRRPTHTEVDPARRQNDAYMAQMMAEAYTNMDPAAWKTFSRKEKVNALQALLNVELDYLNMPYYYDLNDPAVLSISQGQGETSVAAALLSGKAKTELRVRAMCHLAFHLRQLTVSKADGDPWMIPPFERDAMTYENTRYKQYTNTGEENGDAR
jgi:hypothetical protein